MNTGSSARPTRGHPLLVAAAAIAMLAPPSMARAQGAATPAALPPELVAVRAGLEKYQDPIVAVHDGYLSTVACVEFPQGMSEGSMKYVPGGMGVHFLNLNYVGPTLNPAKPQVLIYEPDGDKLKLVAAEWFMPAAVAGDLAVDLRQALEARWRAPADHAARVPHTTCTSGSGRPIRRACTPRPTPP
jgi:hypothetical protein